MKAKSEPTRSNYSTKKGPNCQHTLRVTPITHPTLDNNLHQLITNIRATFCTKQNKKSNMKNQLGQAN